MRKFIILTAVCLYAGDLKPKTRLLTKDELLEFRAINAEVNNAQEALKRLKQEGQELVNTICASVGAQPGKDCRLDETSVTNTKEEEKK